MEEKLMVKKWLCWKGAGTVCEEFLSGPLGGKEPIRVLSCGMIWCPSHDREIILMKMCSVNLGVKKLEEFSNPGQHIRRRNKTELIGVLKTYSERIYKNCVFLDWVLVVKENCFSFCIMLLIAKWWWFSLQLSNCVAGILHTKTCWMCWKRFIVIKSKMSFTRDDRMVMSRKKSKVRFL